MHFVSTAKADFNGTAARLKFFLAGHRVRARSEHAYSTFVPVRVYLFIYLCVQVYKYLLMYLFIFVLR